MTSSFGATNVVVAVRARPFTPQEEEKGEDGSVLTLSMDQKNKTTTLIDLAAGTRKKFTFDYNYWSVNEHDSHFASQEMVFHDLAESQLIHAMKGYNACIFAYGQTSSGKTYTMMGPPATADHSNVNAHTGLIPRLCRNLFERITSDTNELHSFRVEMSFYEIYNEKVYCLLDPSTNGTLRPREDPKAGPYVENLTSVEVTSYRQIAKCLKMGNRERHTSKTRMNDRSSRSHAVFCLTISKSEWQRGDNGGDAVEFISRVNLVDLAGSERVSKAGSTGDVLKEGININKSLTSLGMVIKKLADLNDPSVAADGTYVPYRDSTLTWLLKDNLGGNSKTVMFATLSPCRYNIEETHTTLRYAERVKMIKNAPSINKRGSSRKMIRELRHQVRGLHEQLAAFTSAGAPPGAVLRNLLASSNFYARILSSVMPVSIWAGHPFLVRSQPQNGEPFVWFIKEGYTIVTGGFDSYESIRQTEQSTAWTDALAASQARDVDDRIVAKPRVSTVVTEKIKGPERRPSFMQATFASAFKDTGEVGEHLRAQQTAVPVGEGIAYLSKDPAHQLIGTTSGQSLMSTGSEKQLRRTESQKSEGRGRSNSGASNGSFRRRSLSGLRRRESKTDKPGAREQHEVDNVAVPEVESEEDDREHPEGFPKAAKSSFITKRGRSSSVLGVHIGGTVERTPSNSSTYDSPHSAKKASTPHQVEQTLLSKIWERHRTTQTSSVRFPSRKSDPSDTDDDVDPSKVTLGIDTEWGLRLVSSTIRLPGLPDIDESSTGAEGDAADAAPYPRPYAMFFHRREADSSAYAAPLLLPIGPTYLNGKLLPPQIPVEIPAKCSLKFGLHPTFTFLNPLPTTDHDGAVTTATNLTWNMGSVQRERSPGYSPDSPRSPEKAGGGDSRASHRGGEGVVDGEGGGVGVGVGVGAGGDATAGYRDCTPPRATGSPDTDAYASQKATEPLLGRGDTASMERELRGLGFAGEELATAFVDAKQYATLTEREQRAMLVKRDRDLDEKSRHIAILYERLDDAAKRAAADRDESASPEQPRTGAAARRAAEAAAAAARAEDDEDAATGDGDGDSDNESLPRDPAILQARLQTLKSQLLLQQKTSERLVIENASLKSALRGTPERSPARSDSAQPFSQPNFLASRSQKTSLSSGSPRSSGLVSGEHLWQHTSGDIAASLGDNVAERRASSPVNEVHLDLERDEEREEERGKLARRLKEITLLFEDGDERRQELEQALEKMDNQTRAEREELLQRLASEEYQAQHRLIRSEVNEKYKQLDVLKAQIGDKKHAARQLQESYNERFADLEREAWDKHRSIRELQVEEQDMLEKVQQLRLEEERLHAKVAKYRRMKEDMMESKELNSVDGYEFSGGLRLDDAMFRSKGIQLSRQSRTPVVLRFTSTALLVFNADMYKHAGLHKMEPPLKDIPYERIMSVKQINSSLLQIESHGFTSDVSLLCDNKVKRNAIQKLLMLKTKGVILPLSKWETQTGRAERVDVDEYPSSTSAGTFLTLRQGRGQSTGPYRPSNGGARVMASRSPPPARMMSTASYVSSKSGKIPGPSLR